MAAVGRLPNDDSALAGENRLDLGRPNRNELAEEEPGRDQELDRTARAQADVCNRSMPAVG